MSTGLASPPTIGSIDKRGGAPAAAVGFALGGGEIATAGGADVATLLCGAGVTGVLPQALRTRTNDIQETISRRIAGC